MLTGVRKGEELEITSSSGYLFGAVCKVGMKVIVMQSVAGNTTIASVYTQDREWVIYIFVALYLLALCIIGGRQGIKGCIGLVFTIFLCNLCLPAYDLPKHFTFRVSSVCMLYHHSGDDVHDRRSQQKNHSCNSGNGGRCSDSRNFCPAF